MKISKYTIMSFKLPLFSIFDDIFYTQPKTDDPESSLLCLRIPYDNSVDIKYINTFTIGYLRNNQFKCIKDTGSFIIIINSDFKNGPNGIYCISRSDNLLSGTVKPLVESNGKFEDSLELTWNAGEYPRLNIRTKLSNYKDINIKTLFFYVKVITSF
jgi:hypothetical protein